ncbi:interleukin-1 alpha [Ochotona curzoniae]|uniref:interleukin-1 alpha n=1 Tax=Ochotona curzoniae TaxID=130825 RepID=UPI001B345CB7|nr:interleukin-1 alpha [Ochotona curzoniae]
MAKVPDLFEDLMNCFSENEEDSYASDDSSLNQKSFYDVSYGQLHKDCVNTASRNTSETSVSSHLTYKESVVVVAPNGNILKKRRLSLNQSITGDDLETIASDPEEEIIVSASAPYSHQSKGYYKYLKTIKQEFTLADPLNQILIRDNSDQYLRAAALQNMDDAALFDMEMYRTDSADSTIPVTLRISNTRLFVSAQSENEPVLLKELPETPKDITDSKLDLLFLWESQNSKQYFKSAANPELFIATKSEHLVHMAKGLPSMVDFLISEKHS